MRPMTRLESSRLCRLFATISCFVLLLGVGTLPSVVLAAPSNQPPPASTPPPASAIVEPLPSDESASAAPAESFPPGSATAPAATHETENPPPTAALDLSAPRPPVAEPDTPIFEKWWFWTAIAAVAVTTVVIIASNSGSTPPTTDLGNKVAF